MITIDNESNIPLYMQIYDQIKKQIITKQILGGSKLPSIRALSLTLNVSRNTVESAYLQLSSEGYIESKPGSGYFSSTLESMEFLNSPVNSNIPNYTNLKNIELDENIEHDYKYNFRDRSINAYDFPVQTWKKLTNQVLTTTNTVTFTSYSARKGELDLQIELMKYLHRSRGVTCELEQIIVSSGMEYSLGLLCQLLKKDTDQVAIEDPGYMVARDIFKNNGYNLIPISLERNGINIDELYNSLARLVYVTPSHQFPTGTVMPIKKRLKLLEWANKKQGIIIEDDYDSEFRYKSRPIPSLQSIDSMGCVVYMGTFAKTLSPGLRISYMVLPKSLLERYDELFYWYRVSVSLIQQKTLKLFMELGHWDRHLRKIHLTAMRKHDLLIDTINEHMGDKVIIHGENAGLHIILEFNNGMNEEELIQKSKEHGVLVYPVSTFWKRLDKYPDNMIMLGFGGMPESEIVEGIKALKNALLSQ